MVENMFGPITKTSKQNTKNHNGGKIGNSRLPIAKMRNCLFNRIEFFKVSGFSSTFVAE